MCKLFLIMCICACCVVFEANAVMLSWKQKNISSTIVIPVFNLRVYPKPNQKVPIPWYVGHKVKDLLKNLSIYSLDEKCANGLPMSIAWYPNQPYAGSQLLTMTHMVVFGMFPDIFNMILRSCCKPGTKVTYGLMLRSFTEAEKYFQNNDFDFTFPVYGKNMKSNKSKGMPFVPVLRSPKAVLLTYHNSSNLTKSYILLRTLLGAWPMIIFILLAATCSGTVMFILEYMGSPNEDRPFFSGMWQGFWWAFVTMTTVGYGDCTPKTVAARIFCTMWIIIGICCISLLTGLITTSLTAKTQRYFNIHGAKIGAVDGSEEYKLGVTMFAKMEAYDSPAQLFGYLKQGKLDGMLIDNYALSRFEGLIEDDKDEDVALQNIRIEKLINHGITYGLSVAQNGTKTEHCFRTFLQDNQRSLYDIISRYLAPIKREEETQSYEVKAAEALFYQEDVFNYYVVNRGLIFLASAFFVGLVWEYGYRRHKNSSCFKRKSSGYQAVRTDDINMVVLNDVADNTCRTSLKNSEKDLVEEFEEFEKKWIEQLEAVSNIEPNIEEEQMEHSLRFNLETAV